MFRRSRPHYGPILAIGVCVVHCAALAHGQSPDEGAAAAPSAVIQETANWETANWETATADMNLDAIIAKAMNDEPLPCPCPPEEKRDEGEARFKFKPYGRLWGSMFFASERASSSSFALWIPSPEVEGEPAFDLDVRRTRLGVDIEGPPIMTRYADFKSGGRVEFDFFGQFLTENRSGLRLRHAYWEAKSESTRLLVGQTWDVISPLNPGTLNFPVGWAGGNIGFRRAQFRYERKLAYENGHSLLFQGSLNQDVIDDFANVAGVLSETAVYPVIQARIAYAFPSRGDRERDTTIGFSGHFGETGFDFVAPGPPPLNLPPEDDARFESWSFNLDIDVPISPDLDFRGEFFRGANLSPYFGGIRQGVCPCLRAPIDSIGGWVALEKHWSPSWESNIGMGIDDPTDTDSYLGRVQNSFVFTNLIWHVTKELRTGFEVTWWKTLYQEQRVGLIPPELETPTEPGNAITLEWMVRYDF